MARDTLEVISTASVDAEDEVGFDALVKGTGQNEVAPLG